MIAAISEKEFADQVKDIAAIYGWEFVHFRPAQNRRGHWQTPVEGPLGRGWTDWIFVRTADRRGRTLVFAELKSETGKVSADQMHVITALRAAGQEAFVWRPRDLAQITEVLA